MSALHSDARKTRHDLRQLEGAVTLSAGLQAAEAQRERRSFALVGLALTAINVLVAVGAVVYGVIR